MNFERYPWLADLTCQEATLAIRKAREQYKIIGAVTFEYFITEEALSRCVREAREQEDDAFTTDDTHTAHLLPIDSSTFPLDSVRNHEMRTQVASIAFDELPEDSELSALYRHPVLRELVARIVHEQGDTLYLSEDPLGCCSINVFRPQYHHSFHFDESEFSTTLMLQEASVRGTGLFQYTHPLRETPDNLALETVAATLRSYDETTTDTPFCEAFVPPPSLHTLKFMPGTLSIFSGSKSLHRVTKVEGDCSRLVAVLTFASQPGFRNSAKVQKLFWGRSA